MFVNSGLWITWYNLPEKDREEYLSWLYGTYIPKVLARPGVLSAAHYASEPPFAWKRRLQHTTDRAVPVGDRYILIFNGKEPYAFANPMPSRFHAGLTEQDRKMLAIRIGERSNVMTVERQVLGPDANQRDDMAFGAGIQIGSFNSGSYEDEDELADWYAQWRLPCMERLPGCTRVRKLVSISGWAKHAILYEFTSLEAHHEKFHDHEKDNPEMDAWSERVVNKLVHAPGSPNVARRIWPPVK